MKYDTFEFADCLLIIPRHNPRLFLLNPIARRVWEETARGLSPIKIANRLAERFKVPRARARADVDGILGEWRAHGLLGGGSPPSPSDVHKSDGVAHAGRPSPVSRRFHAERIYRLCGRPIRIRSETPEIEQAIHPPLAHSVVRSSQPVDSLDIVRDGGGYLVVCNGSDVERAAAGEEALGQVLGRILELSYPKALWLAVMHAAAVGGDRGAVVLAGDSGSGKSTLTAALVHAGLRYFSDDVVPLDQSLRIRPMPLGISLKQGSWPVLASRYPKLGMLPVHQGVPRRYLPIATEHIGPAAGAFVDSIVFLRYRENQPRVSRPLSDLEILERLTGTRSWLSLDRQRFVDTLRWIKNTPAYELTYGSLKEGMRVVRQLLDGERRERQPQQRQAPD